MFRVLMSFDEGDTWYTYGTYNNANKANEVAMEVRDSRGCWVFVEEV